MVLVIVYANLVISKFHGLMETHDILIFDGSNLTLNAGNIVAKTKQYLQVNIIFYTIYTRYSLVVRTFGNSDCALSAKPPKIESSG